jgi:hypothetical protein
MASISSFSGGFKWPNVQYEYAKLYLLNIELAQPNHFDWNVYENGVYATSKVGSGYDIEDSFLSKLHASMVRGVNELRIGLGKCYMPRHGIIYYNQKGEPVAAFTLCFECDRISFWSQEELPDVNYEGLDNDWDKAEKQIEKMKELFVKESYPMYNNNEEYQEFLRGNKDFEDKGEMFLKDDKLDEKFKSAYTLKEVKTWVKSAKKAVQLSESHEVNVTPEGDEYYLNTLVADKGNSNFLFASTNEDARLIQAYITHGSIVLPNGLSVGMSVEDIQSSFLIYDGIAWPEHIQVKGNKITIDYYFDHRTLAIIKMSFGF